MFSNKEKQRLMLESLKTVNPKFINFIGVISPGAHENHKTVYAVYTVFTNGGHAGKNWCLVMKARRWRINKNCK